MPELGLSIISTCWWMEIIAQESRACEYSFSIARKPTGENEGPDEAYSGASLGSFAAHISSSGPNQVGGDRLMGDNSGENEHIRQVL